MVTEKMIEVAAPSGREAIARIIDPHNFMISGSAYGVDDEGFKTTWAYMAQQVALTKADQIIAALSTDAGHVEPFGWTSKHVNDGEQHRQWGRNRENVAGYKGVVVQALYVESPAPSVAVKALQMADETFRDLGWHDKYEITTAALSALSAQVQDVATMPIPQNKETLDQVAAVMLLNGTPEQQAEALRYAAAPAAKQEEKP